MNLTGRPIYQKDPTYRTKRNSGDDPAYLDAVRRLPCCICQEYGMQQLSFTTAHHCIMGRGGNRKTPDRMAIPLCCGHHQGHFDKSKIALHKEPAAWREAYGLDTDWISWTQERISI